MPPPTSEDDAAIRRRRREEAAGRLGEREQASAQRRRLSAAERMRRCGIIDAAQARMHRIQVGERRRPRLAGPVIHAALALAFALLVATADAAPWWSIAAYCGSLLSFSLLLGRRSRRRDAEDGWGGVDLRVPRTGRESFLLGFVFFGVMFVTPIVMKAAGTLWAAPVLALLAGASRYLLLRGWYRAFERPPVVRTRGRAEHDPALDDDDALAVAAALALVEWARAAVVADATGLAADRTHAAARRLEEAGIVRIDDDDGDGHDGRGPRLSLAFGGRPRYVRHVRLVERPPAQAL